VDDRRRPPPPGLPLPRSGPPHPPPRPRPPSIPPPSRPLLHRRRHPRQPPSPRPLSRRYPLRLPSRPPLLLLHPRPRRRARPPPSPRQLRRRPHPRPLLPRPRRRLLGPLPPLPSLRPPLRLLHRLDPPPRRRPRHSPRRLLLLRRLRGFRPRPRLATDAPRPHFRRCRFLLFRHPRLSHVRPFLPFLPPPFRLPPLQGRRPGLGVRQGLLPGQRRQLGHRHQHLRRPRGRLPRPPEAVLRPRPRLGCRADPPGGSRGGARRAQLRPGGGDLSVARRVPAAVGGVHLLREPVHADGGPDRRDRGGAGEERRPLLVALGGAAAALEGFEGARGLVVRGWAPQVAILGHAAVASFVTHCGWNSVMEGVTAGVALLVWPMEAEQFVNAKLLVEDKGVAVRVGEGSGAEGTPAAEELARTLAQSVAEGGEWQEVRDRVAEVRGRAVEAVAEGGSSHRALQELTIQLSQLRK
ncbi:unnamed protein product, partial [Musa textilis]